jgi:hypothetical protein
MPTVIPHHLDDAAAGGSKILTLLVDHYSDWVSRLNVLQNAYHVWPEEPQRPLVV